MHAHLRLSIADGDWPAYPWIGPPIRCGTQAPGPQRSSGRARPALPGTAPGGSSPGSRTRVAPKLSWAMSAHPRNACRPQPRPRPRLRRACGRPGITRCPHLL